MAHTHNELQYLTLEEIRQQLDCTIDQLRAFADRTEVRDYAGAIPNPKTRGVMWPPDAVPLLERLIAMRQAGKLEPKNVKGILEDLVMTGNGQSGRSPDMATDGALARSIGKLTRSPDSATAIAVKEVAGELMPAALAVSEAAGELALAAGELMPVVVIIAGQLERIAVAQEVRAVLAREVFDAGQAAAFLCCSVRLLRREVKPSFRLGRGREGDRWKRCDLLEIKGGTS